jgi:hypothetical protein
MPSSCSCSAHPRDQTYSRLLTLLQNPTRLPAASSQAPCAAVCLPAAGPCWGAQQCGGAHQQECTAATSAALLCHPPALHAAARAPTAGSSSSKQGQAGTTLKVCGCLHRCGNRWTRPNWACVRHLALVRLFCTVTHLHCSCQLACPPYKRLQLKDLTNATTLTNSAPCCTAAAAAAPAPSRSEAPAAALPACYAAWPLSNATSC